MYIHLIAIPYWWSISKLAKKYWFLILLLHTYFTVFSFIPGTEICRKGSWLDSLKILNLKLLVTLLDSYVSALHHYKNSRNSLVFPFCIYGKKIREHIITITICVTTSTTRCVITMITTCFITIAIRVITMTICHHNYNMYCLLSIQTAAFAVK